MSDCTAQGALCGTPTTADTASASEPGTCRGGLGYYSCVISAHDVTGVLAFRGWSHRIQTMTSRFRFYSGSQQEWDNGYRVDAGGFSVSGNTVRTKSNGVTDTWPTRSDCYTNSSYNSGDCTSGGQNTTLYSEGHLRMYGRDTWRWEKQLFTLCDGGAFGFTTCSYITDEHVFETAYNGGTEIGDSTTYSNYNKPPSGIRLNHYGAWTKYLPGTTREDFLSDSYSHSNGATVGMNFPESYGAATFSSRMTNTTPSTMKNNDIFAGPAGRLPWMSDPNPSTGSLGWTYLYDMGSGNKAHWISCELATGWTLPSDTEYCWRAGS